jgi:hypothetical protein
MKIYQAVQKLLVEDTHTDRQTDRLVIDKPTFFLESRLKAESLLTENCWLP